MSTSQETQSDAENSPETLLTEEDSFFLMRLLKFLETEADQRRLVGIAEQIARSAQK